LSHGDEAFVCVAVRRGLRWLRFVAGALFFLFLMKRRLLELIPQAAYR
jgi:hypothetical protein